jgi:EpsI family protein
MVLALATCAAIGALVWRPTTHLADTRPKPDLETMFPRSFGQWTIDDGMVAQLVSPDQQAVLNKIYNQTLSRTYMGPNGARIMLSVAYGGDQSDGTRAHRPEVCYPSQGFEVDRDKNGDIQLGAYSLRTRQLVAKQGNRIEPITYWVMVGDRVALSGTEQKMAQLAYSVRGVIPDGMLVRVSTIDPDPERAYAIQRKFIEDLSGALQGLARERTFGIMPS